MPLLTTPAFRTLRVFACHASEDKPAVAKLCDRLTSEGIDCWFDVRSLAPGTNWAQEIEKAIRRSDAILVCLSKTTTGKKTFLRSEIRLVLEAAAAQARPSSFIFPVLLEDAPLPRRFHKWQAVDATTRKGMSTLLVALRNLAAGLPGVSAPGDRIAERDWEPPRMKGRLPNIVKSTRSYERWLRRLTPVVEAEFKLKHRVMSYSPFAFFRATFYRWAEAWPRECPVLAAAPLVLSAGEVNIEDFGTWLDPEGRMGWGITTFAEAYPLPYTSDLVRLATSVAIVGEVLKKAPRGLSRICEGMVEAYSQTLASGGAPFVLSARHKWLFELLRQPERTPMLFWHKLLALPAAKNVPPEVLEALERSLPMDVPFETKQRQAALGSLGRPRYFGVAQWMGGPLAAEARYIAVPAGAWAAGRKQDVRMFQNVLLETAHRTPNLRAGVWKGVLVRRIGPESTRVELTSLGSRRKDWMRLLKACAVEVGNVHMGTPGSQVKVLEHLAKLPGGWLARAARAMAERNQADYAAWRKSHADST